jgi:predicted nucleic acid-binding protein
MIIDTSVFIEFLRGSGSRADDWLATQVSERTALVIPEVVAMELLIGTTDETIARRWRQLLQRFDIEPLAALRDSEEAAAIHRRCRRAGHTVRSLIDCQIAAVGLRMDLPVVHRDHDFEVIAEHCGLATVPLFD